MFALLLIAHGSRNPEANADLDHVAEGLRQRGHSLVQSSFLELAEPDIDGGAARCVEQGAERVVLVPYFLSPGIHVRRDLTAARERLAQRYPSVEFRLAEPLGRHPLLLDVVEARIVEAGEKPTPLALSPPSARPDEVPGSVASRDAAAPAHPQKG